MVEQGVPQWNGDAGSLRPMSSTKKKRRRLRATPSTLRELYVYSGNRCAFTDCNAQLLLPDGNWNCQTAHINAVGESAARGKHDLDEEQLREPSNLVLMCLKHHEIVDGVDADERYTVDVVKKMKADHERGYREAVAALERVLDTSAGDEPVYPANLCAAGYGDEHAAEDVQLMRPWVEAIAKQPVGIRDLIALIVIHSDARRAHSSTTSVQIEGIASISENEIYRRAKHLEAAGLLDIEHEEEPGVVFFDLLDPSRAEAGWNLFSALWDATNGAPDLIQRAIVDLDFTVFES